MPGGVLAALLCAATERVRGAAAFLGLRVVLHSLRYATSFELLRGDDIVDCFRERVL